MSLHVLNLCMNILKIVYFDSGYVLECIFQEIHYHLGCLIVGLILINVNSFSTNFNHQLDFDNYYCMCRSALLRVFNKCS